MGHSFIEYTQPTDYARLMEVLQFFEEKYGLAEISYIGTSVLGRGIPMVSFGRGASGRAVMYVGCHHGSEWLTSSLLLRFIDECLEAFEKNSRVRGVNVRRLLGEYRIHVIPQLNVDGADIAINGALTNAISDRLIEINGGEDFTHWQANAHGVDLNHNYDFGFYEYKKTEIRLGTDHPGPSKYSGPSPESEPESAFLANLLRFSDNIRLLLTFHTQGEEIYCSGGENVPRCIAIAHKIEKLTGYRLRNPKGSAAYGGLTDWYLSEIKRPAYTIECGLGENPLPPEDCAAIYSTLESLLFKAPLLR